MKQYYLLSPGGHDYLRAPVSGLWVTDEFTALEPFILYPDGSFRLIGSISAVYTNVGTGERVWMKFSYNTTMDAGWNIIRGGDRISPVACRVLH
jgi:hypothetical protein